MNRIYQGKVTNVELANPDGKTAKEKKWLPFDPDPKTAREKWQKTLLEHHELFQDAVNYYTLALAAMANGLKPDSPKGKAALAWCEQVRGSWLKARRKAIEFPGPHVHLVKCLEVNPTETDAGKAFNTSAAALLKNSPATVEVRAKALLQMLEEVDQSDLNRFCVSRLPWLCTAHGKLGATPKSVSHKQEIEMLQSICRIHDATPNNFVKIAEELNVGCFLAQPPANDLVGEEAIKEAEHQFAAAAKKVDSLTEVEANFKSSIQRRGTNLCVPRLGRKPKGAYPFALVFKLFPVQETWKALKDKTAGIYRKASKQMEFSQVVTRDFIAEARTTADQPLFDYFTNRALIRKPDNDDRAVWFDFDLAAFIEAIKAPHRYFQDSLAREKAADSLRKKKRAMEGRGGEVDDEHEEDEESVGAFGFEGDKRVDLLRELVTDTLGYAAEAEQSEAVAEKIEYTIQERTLRGVTDIRQQWRKLAEKGQAAEEKLLEVLAKQQAKHRDDFGSAALYRALAQPKYHPIWRDSGTEKWHADDPLKAWRAYNELRFELENKERPIRFTPAHAEYSPRYFIIPKLGGFGSDHKPGTLAFSCGIVLQTERGWEPVNVCVNYSAPRLRRDELRYEGDTELDAVSWLQPMMKALGATNEKAADFSNCRVMLQPDGPGNMQLTFPLEVIPDELITGLGKAERWRRQFNMHPDGDNFYNATLRWPHEKQPAKPPSPWHDVVDLFSCLSVDMGQRVAGAFALLEVRANYDFSKKPSRFIGKTPGKKWTAALAANGLFRLSGEDRDEWRQKTSKDADKGDGFDFREELHGRRGRMARDFETKECRELLNAFLGDADAKEFLAVGEESRLSFPEQNDKLLIAARRAQSRIARLHRWCWFLGGDKKGGDALTEIRELLNAADEDVEHWLPDTLKVFAEKDNDPRLKEELAKFLEKRLRELPDLSLQLANRILPLRGRTWKWEAHPEATTDNRIFFLTQNGKSFDSKEHPVWLRGQRGLSIERIEQIEELRRRFQALNQTLRRNIGGKPPVRRDESVPDPCPDLLEKLDNLKEQRINQTAHMILAEALGVRLAKPPANKAALKKERDQHGVYEKFRDPVDFIVIEDLSRYRASQGRAPRENSRLMKWCHRAVRDKLRGLCEPFGIPVLETPAAYSSRFCSRSGVAGFRAVEVTAGFENEPPWRWLKEKKDNNDQLTGDAQLIRNAAMELYKAQHELEAAYAEKHSGKRQPKRTLLLPQAGGPIFVPITDKVDQAPLQPAIVQADLNAAISLGLRAISDPRLWEIHPRLRTERMGGEVKKQKKKSKVAADTTPAKPDETVRLKTREKRKYGESGLELNLGTPPKGSSLEDTRNPNYFSDLADIANWDFAEVSDAIDSNRRIKLVSGKALWSAVKNQQWNRCMEINRHRLETWKKKIEKPEEAKQK